MSRVTYANTPTTAEQEALRASRGLRVVSAAEEGSGVNVLPGGVFGYTYSPGLLNAPLFAVKRYRNYETQKLADGTVLLVGFADPATAEALKPFYPYGCKRPTFHDEYLPTFNRPNVTLVDVAPMGVRRINEGGIEHNGKQYDLDVLI